MFLTAVQNTKVREPRVTTLLDTDILRNLSQKIKTGIKKNLKNPRNREIAESESCCSEEITTLRSVFVV